MPTKKVTLILRDPDMIAAWNAIPSGARQHTAETALRAYLLPGGQTDLIAAIDRLREGLQTGPIIPPASIPEAPDEQTRQMVHQSLADLMAWE
ncbi:MAG: hypothetical protein M0Z36_13530 [Thermaerobacter sp.]|nr:hypothetical protein [Thermaerobacter sp.]